MGQAGAHLGSTGREDPSGGGGARLHGIKQRAQRPRQWLLLLLLPQQALHRREAPLQLRLALPGRAQLRLQLQLAGLPPHVLQLAPVNALRLGAPQLHAGAGQERGRGIS